ncbi:sister chromatid cohesion 1 protein 1-like isoform X3 [Phaseolus vulgaris]|uniref:sister chromatid cohesion 1 protein 1-like isoform X3 n=1 Tax=Phaseolus vulgaris TaxID=3885 RepID=UPI0035CB96B0
MWTTTYQPVGSQGTSERTKNATDYLKTLLHPINPILEDSAGDQDLPDLSLNQILEGKTRAIAARMFFEVLVLGTNKVVDVKQEEPYGDVSLKLAATPSNDQS